MKEVYVLLADGDGTMRSSDTPFGVAVTTKEEAERYVKEGNVGYSHSYRKVTIFENKDDGIAFAFPNPCANYNVTKTRIIKYFHDTQFTTSPKCPYIEPETMVGSIYCTTKCQFFRFRDSENKTVACCYDDK